MEALIKQKPLIGGVILGVLYGLLIRIFAELQPVAAWFEIISYSFLTITPFTVGAIAVYFAADKQPISVKKTLSVASLAMLFFLLGLSLLLLEGMVCIVLILPVFFIAAILGGLAMSMVNNRYLSKAKTTLHSFLVLPFLLNPVEAQLPNDPHMGMVKSSVVIEAKAEDIFNQLTHVRKIQKGELGFSFMHWIGLPRPIEASMNDIGVGAIRTSKWEMGVQFKERITRWEKGKRLHYEFIIPKGSIPREALDRHVELGGDYFTVLHGGYDIQAIGKGRCRLTLNTVYKNKSHLNLFGRIWAYWVLNDFHYSILKLMKRRSEADTQAIVAQR